MRKMSLRSLAEYAGASASFISQLERGHTSASIGMLRRIAGSLGLTMADLFSEDAASGPRVLRHADRPELPAGPGARTGPDPYTHGDAQEFLLVLHGQVVLWLGEPGQQDEYRLGAGDSVEYRTSSPHRLDTHGSA